MFRPATLEGHGRGLAGRRNVMSGKFVDWSNVSSKAGNDQALRRGRLES